MVKWRKKDFDSSVFVGKPVYINISNLSKIEEDKLLWKLYLPPTGSKKLSSKKGLLYATNPTLQQGFNAAINKLIQVHGAEISSEKLDQPNQFNSLITALKPFFEDNKIFIYIFSFLPLIFAADIFRSNSNFDIKFKVVSVWVNWIN